MSTDTERPTGTAPAPARVDLAGRRDDLRVLRRPDREEAQPDLDGVVATVNFATETAHRRLRPVTVSLDDLVVHGGVDRLHRSPPGTPSSRSRRRMRSSNRRRDETDAWRRRVTAAPC